MEEDESFTGTFDGDDYTISNLSIIKPDEESVGFIRILGNDSPIGTLTKLGLEDVQITGDYTITIWQENVEALPTLQ